MSALPYTVVDPIETPGRLDLDKAHDDDAAFDLRAANDVLLMPGEIKLIPTGIRIALPTGYAGFVMARSGMALKRMLTIPNAPGLIDSGYRGDVGVILWNFQKDRGQPPELIYEGDRIAQLLVVEVAASTARFFSPERFQAMWGETERGERGFGSSGR